MDNLSHSLIGAVVAEAAVRWLPLSQSNLSAETRRKLLFPLLVIGSNFPDADLLYSSIATRSVNLGYLLHHRGHTHTIVGALLAAAVLYACCYGWLRWRSMLPTSRDKQWLRMFALLGPLLHIGMDATNSYGVHPFWPLDNRWFYGDAVFIIEPLFWVAAAPLVLLLQSRLGRTVMTMVQLVALALAYGSGLVPLALASAMTFLLLCLLLFARFSEARIAALGSVLVTGGILLMFLFAGHRASEQMEQKFTQQFPTLALLDTVLTPAPVNPFCWDVIAVALAEDNYTLQRATLSLTPEWLPATPCPIPNATAATSVPLVSAAETGNASVYWRGQFTMSRTELQEIVANNCEAAAYVRFGRALTLVRQGERIWLGDLRFDRESGQGFAEIEVSALPPSCPTNIPPWLPPRSDLLRN